MDGYEVWETSSGEKIPLEKMRQDHLENSINYVMERLKFFNISQDDEPEWFNRECEELPEPPEPIWKQWYLHHGWNYIRAFTAELEKRKSV